MLHSKAAAALLRLKEIDKKYRIGQLEKEQNNFLVSTENSTNSSLTSPKGVSFTSKRRINLRKDRAAPKRRLEIQMPETYIENENDVFHEGKESSAVILSKSDESLNNRSNQHLETSRSSTMETQSPKERLESASKSQVKSDNSFSKRRSEQLESQMDKIVTTDDSTSEDILTISARTDLSLSRFTSVNTNKNSRKINTTQLTSGVIPRPETRKVKTVAKNLLPESDSPDKHVRNRSVSLFKVNSNIERTESSEISKDYENEKQTEREPSGNYTDDTFEETLGSTILTIDNEQSQLDRVSGKSEKTDTSDGSEEDILLDVKATGIAPNVRHVADRNESDTNNKQFTEIIAPKMTEKINDDNVDLCKGLSKIIKNTENTEVLTSVLSLKSAKHKSHVTKRKHRIPRKSQDDSLTDNKSYSAKTTSKSDAATNEASGDKKADDKREPKVSQRKKSDENSMSTANSNSQTSSSKKSAKKPSKNVKTKKTEVKVPSKIKSKEVTPRSIICAANSQHSNKKLHHDFKTEKISNRDLSAITGNEGQIIGTKTLSDSEKDESNVIRKSKHIENFKSLQTNAWTLNGNERKENTTGERLVNNKIASSKDEADRPVENLNLRNSEEMHREFEDKSDVTSVLRKLNKDALEAVTQRYKTVGHQFPKEEFPKSVRRVCTCGARAQKIPPFTEVKVTNPMGPRTRIKKTKKTFRHRRKGFISLRKEDERVGHERKQSHRLRKRMTALKLQEERRNLHRYFRAVENTFPEVARGDRAFIKPLEFPKIEAFARPDTIEEQLRSDNNDNGLVFYERLLDIRQWLKDRLVQYQTYCKLAQTINAGYVPTTLQDTRKVIRELRSDEYDAR